MPTKKAPTELGEFIKFKPLMAVDAAQLTAAFEQMAKSLTGGTLEGKARFRLWSDSHKESFTVAMKRGKAVLEHDAEGAVAFEVITTPETWLEIAQGKLAPLDAFTRGRMRVRGDIALGQKIMHRLAAFHGRTDIC